ncbi:serine hydroxymethyltransferase [Streptomyces yangpuensis]|uniref:serine hydroxymethyltransferase n=1 Tax=Streptomyces yangpuensis TaxID=1648182 RepID=UPI00382AFD08
MTGTREHQLGAFARTSTSLLWADDPALANLLTAEYQRQQNDLCLVASSSIAHPSVFAAQSSVTDNLTTEGYPGRRYHGGCLYADEIERMAVERCRSLFGATYANVQPYSGSMANNTVLFSLLSPGDTVLSLDLASGGHLSHGARVAASGKYFDVVSYGVGPDGLIDYDAVRGLAERTRPKLLISGASSYPRTIDFARFREIADSVGALLLADISHISGLVAAGLHPSPIDSAHITTTSTYKQLGGPRGGLIMLGRDRERPVGPRGTPLHRALDQAVFPFFQGTPSLGSIAAKARALDLARTPAFKAWMGRVVTTAGTFAEQLADSGHAIVTGGSDNHIVMVDLSPTGLTGAAVQDALELCGVIVNKNMIPGDKRPAGLTSGLRLGTNVTALRGMEGEAISECAALVSDVVATLRETDEQVLDARTQKRITGQVADLCARFPIPYYP